MLLKGYDAYYDGYEENGKAVPGYRDLIDELSGEFPLGQPITGEQKQKDFIKLYGNILRLKNILSAFDQFAGNEILPERDFQDYQSVYLDLYQAYRPKTDGDKENINDDITFEIELIRQVEINIDYIPKEIIDSQFAILSLRPVNRSSISPFSYFAISLNFNAFSHNCRTASTNEEIPFSF